MGLRFSFALSAVLMLLPVAVAAGTPAAPQGRLPRDAIPAQYSLTLTVDPRTRGFHGHDEISVEITHPVRTLWIHGRNLAVERASVRLADGRTIAARYRQVDPSGVALLSFPVSLPAGKATLLFDYHAGFNGSLNGLYKVVQNKSAYAISQFQAIGARRMFPCFDEPDDKATFSLAVNAPQGDVVITNTKVISRNQTGGGMVHWVFATTAKLPTYLLNLDVGPFDVVNMGNIPPDRWRRYPLALRGIAPKGEGRQMRYALSLTPKLVLAFERYLGIGFPFDKLDMIAAPDLAGGAVENAGAITFRRRFLLMGPRASLEQRRDSLLVQAHELAHQWFGDLVTPKWWDDVWLNDALSSWMAARAANAVMPQFEVSRHTLDGGLEAMNLDQLPSARAIHNPVNSASDIGNAFDAITYKKGAAVLAMFENYVGAESWKNAIHTFLLKYAGGNATQADFVAIVAKLSHDPGFIKAFQSYLDQSGIPDMSVVTRCSETPVLTVVQSMYAPIGLMVSDRQWQVPMCVSQAGGKVHCRMVGRTADIRLGTVCPAYVMPNAQGAGYYRFAFDSKGWDRLLKVAPELDAADQITLFANMQAALGADQLSARKFVSAIRTLAPTAHWDLIRMMSEALRQDRLTLLRPADLGSYEDFIRRTFGPRLAKKTLRGGSTPEQILTRAALAQILVEDGHDPHTLTTLAKAARVYVASDGRNLGGLPPSLAREAMRAGVMVYGSVFGKSLIEGFLASPDDYFHRSVIYALMGSSDPNFLKGFFDLALTPRMNTGDVGYLFRYAGTEPLARAQLWDWYKAHYQPLEARISSEGMLVVPRLFDDACSSAARTQLSEFFAPRVKTIPGLARTLALTEQRIDQCISLRDSKGAAIRAALIASGR